MLQRRAGLRQGTTVIEAGNLNPGSCLEWRHVIRLTATDPKAPTEGTDSKAPTGLHVVAQVHRRPGLGTTLWGIPTEGCTWPLRRTGGSSRYPR